jgi:hypothetical protein
LTYGSGTFNFVKIWVIGDGNVHAIGFYAVVGWIDGF